MKESNFPFYYEIRFRVLKYKDNNNIEIESFKREFENINPLIAREEAFNEFKEYLTYIPSERIVKKSGNFKIIKPISIQNLVNKIEDNDIEAFHKKFNRFQEEISIHLIISNENLAEDIQDFHENTNDIPDKDSQRNVEFAVKLAEINASLGLKPSEGIEKDFLIHKVGSSLGTSEEQRMIDNLWDTEMKLYKHCNIDTSDYETVVAHYGLDFGESGEDEDQCERTILETPHVWSSKERYLREFVENKESIPQNDNPDILNFEEIFAHGEGHQVEFKPALRYNFKYGKEAHFVRQIIAKAICSFLNSNGGLLFIGVTDKGKIQGLEISDYLLFENNYRDKFRNEFDNLISYFFPLSITPFISLRIEKIQGKDIGVLEIKKSNQPVFIKNMNKENGEIQKEFYIRCEASSRLITDVEEIIQYVFNNWKEK